MATEAREQVPLNLQNSERLLRLCKHFRVEDPNMMFMMLLRQASNRHFNLGLNEAVASNSDPSIAALEMELDWAEGSIEFLRTVTYTTLVNATNAVGRLGDEAEANAMGVFKLHKELDEMTSDAIGVFNDSVNDAQKAS